MLTTLSWEKPAEALLPGKDLTSISPPHVRRWVTIYTELIELTQNLITASRERAVKQSQQANPELVGYLLPMLHGELESFEHRLAFWQRQGQSEGD